ncbi:aldehyde dehydrogenase family protein [Klebsiella pneumoniae subsp. pneumoniae]|nr:aldehyde dehydrogenase family protein [Klebsiella pneumoniae subsp. pneumoniae]
MSPTLLDGVTREMRLWREESFGPVKAIIRVHSEVRRRCGGGQHTASTVFPLAVHQPRQRRAWNVAQRLTDRDLPISMAQRCMMRRKCRLAAAKPPAIGRFGGQAGIARIHRAALDNDPDPTRELPF